MRVQKTWGSALVAAVALAACGGGSDSPAEQTSITISGTAAKGAALAGATVSVKCAAGTGTVPTATTASSGAYSITITGASLPCVLKVVGTDGSTFHSLVRGSGKTGNFAVNITPLTEMIVAHVAAAAPTAFYSGFGSSTTVPAAKVTEAIAYVAAALAPLTSLPGDPIADALVVGNPHDQKIDAAMSGLLNAGVALAQAIDAILANPAAPDVVAAPLRVRATSCAALKSGKYRLINPYETDLAWKYHVVDINAAALTVTTFDGAVVPVTANGECKFTIDGADETNTVMVSPAGVLVVYGQSKVNAASRWASVGLPEQALPVAEFAGTWNLIDWDPNSGNAIAGYVGAANQATFDSTGQVTASSQCSGLTPCTTNSGPFPRVAATATGGGFDLIENGTTIGRVFLFKAFNGKRAFVAVTNDGEFLIGSRQEAIGTLPAVGDVTNYREFSLNGNGTLSALLDETNTVTAVDATAKAATRLRTRDSRVDTIAFDKPRNGLRYRAPNSCTNNVTGAVLNCAETVQLPLQGMGITLSVSVTTSPTGAFLSVSVNKP